MFELISMKTLLIIAGSTLALCSFRAPVKLNQGTMQAARLSTWNSALKVDQSEFETLTSAYANDHASATLGGQIGKAELKSFINSIPNSQDYIRFRFCTDPMYRKISLMMKGDNSLFRNTQYMRNGGSEDGFCPSICNLQSNASNVTLDISASAFETLAASFSSENPGATLGGRIDKDAVMEIINSLPAEAVNVAFRFCTDAATGKTSVIFVGGTVGQTGGAQLIYRNGGSADAFCPDICN